jgi:hypothetical protein
MTHISESGLPPGAEALPAPYENFFVLERSGELELRFAAQGTNPLTESRKIALPVWIPVKGGRSLADVFLAAYPAPLPKPRVLSLHVAWEHQCGATIWERGSEEEMLEDLAAVSRVFGRKHGVEIATGTAFFYGQTGTPIHEPKFSYASFDFIMRGDYAVITKHLHEFVPELQQLEPGLFARNRPVGCSSYNRDAPHFHLPIRLFLPLVQEDRASGHAKLHPAQNLIAADAIRYAEIEKVSAASI